MSGRSALVVGAGIGGLAAAGALARAGWEVTVHEQAKVLREVGAGLSIAPNAMRALEWLGLGPEAREHAQGQGIGVKSRSGRWMVRLTATDLEQRYGNPMFAMHRADLHRLLLTAAGATTVHTGHRATGISAGPGGAEVTFATAGGPVTAGADLVVAADGVHSRLRAALFPGHPGATYAGYVCWRGIAPAGIGRRLTDPPVWTDTWGRGVRFGTAPLADGRVFWYGSAAGPEGAFARDTPADVAARFATWHPPIPDLPWTSAPDSLLRNDIYFVKDPLPRFVRDRVVLLGDAAHAVTPDIGQGACLAIEDAAVLAAATAGDDLDAGLRAYDEVRRPRTQRLARISGSSARVQQANHRVTAGLRDLMVRLLPKRAYLNAGADALAWTPPGPEVRAPAVTTLDVQYSPSALVPDLSVTLAEYHARSARARAGLEFRTLRYGPGARMALDFFPAAQPAAPLFAYVHGGFWQEMGKEDFSFPALDLVPAGIAFAALGYGLAPACTLDEIVASVRRGLRWLVAQATGLGADPRRVHIGGSSAGAHLAAMALSDGSGPSFASATLVSGVYDLEPIRHSYVNDPLGLDATAAHRNSPIHHLPARLPPTIVARGAIETDEFARQHTDFAAAIASRAESLDEFVVTGRNHFDVTFDLTDRTTALGSALLARLTAI